ncbi:forkhead box protein M1 isoform X2 [Trichomycterus rosablanca]|uniref:forkhead box protein M1 isoform X2 n=1 Tax=Trichomycterus rosablanca TaxID=2290929 RepID=UPI002F35CB77
MNRMRQSPRRPLILKRRKLPFHRNEANGPQTKTAPTPSAQSCPDGICVMDHPAMPNTQVVVIPKTADLQSVIGALTAKGKEHGAQGPNKFILLSGNSGFEKGSGATSTSAPITLKSSLEPKKCLSESVMMDSKPLMNRGNLKTEAECSPLDESLTNIQWLGKMSSYPEPAKKGSTIETPGGVLQHPQFRHPEEDVVAGKEIPLERPPYSYMAMIQFAINSNENRRMTLKEIYNWIEDHFPYFRNVAKPGWKNSIRHNLSLHDMFVRETTPDAKISFWTIKPEANRCLTLDQVYKQQKRVMPELRKAPPGTTERKMKPLLPRTDSYLVPIQLPLTQSLILPSTPAFPLSTPQHSSSSSSGSKRVRIAPKVMQGESSSSSLCTPSLEVKDESVCVSISTESCSRSRKEISSSRRKQRLVPPSKEEPVLLLPDSTFFDSGVASDISTFQEVEVEADADPEPSCQPQPESETYIFKTPIKSSNPASSTPSKMEPWKITPLGKGGRSVLDFSPIRTPQRHEQVSLSFSSTPFKDLPLFSSPRELLTSCSREGQSGGANRSFTEGLVLDTMNDSLSKILVDISFSGLEDDDLGMANISWSQFIPDLK